MDDFTGFDDDALGALAALPGWTKQDRAAHKHAYDHLVETTRQFAQAVGDRIRETVSDTVSVEPRINGSISPFNRDLRFVEDRSKPYKDCLMVSFWDGPDKKAAPTLRIRLTPERAGFASGAVFTKSARDQWREAIAGDQGVQLVAALDELRAAHAGLDIPEPELKRIPAPFTTEHPRGDLLRHKSLQVRWEDPLPDSVGSADFVDWCGARLDELAPVHTWLRDTL